MQTSDIVNKLFPEPGSESEPKLPIEDQIAIEQTNNTPSYRYNLPKTEYDDLMQSASEEHGVPYGVLYRNTRQESEFNPRAISKTGARGIAQFMPQTAKDMGVSDPHDPKQAIPGSAKYLRQLYDQFGDWKLAVAAYNAGPNAVKRAGNKIPNIAETQNHVARVFKDYDPSSEELVSATVPASSQPKSLSTEDIVNKLFPEEPQEAPVTKPVEPGFIDKVGKFVSGVFSGEPTITPKEYYTRKSGPFYGLIHPAISAKMGMQGFGPKPEGGWSEDGKPLDANGVAYTDEGLDNEKVATPMAETLKGLTSLATHPMEVIRGGLDFFLSIPAFTVGMVGAAGRAGKELTDQLSRLPQVKGPTDFDISGEQTVGKLERPILDLNKVYDALSKGMEESFKFFDPAKKMLTGEPTKESQLVGRIVMAPAEALSATGHAVAAYEGFKDYPNIQGAAKITGDIVGLMVNGMLLHGGSRRADFSKKMEDVTKQADIIKNMETEINQMPDPILKNIQLKELQIRKQMLENKAAEYAKEYNDDLLMIEDAARRAEQMAQEKSRPVVESPDIAKTARKVEKAEAKEKAEAEVEVPEKVKTKVEELKKEAEGQPEVGKVVVDPKTGKKTFKVTEVPTERRSRDYVPATPERTAENFPPSKATDEVVSHYRSEDKLWIDEQGKYKFNSHAEATEVAKNEGGTVIPVSDGKFVVALEPQGRVKFARDLINKEAAKYEEKRKAGGLKEVTETETKEPVVVKKRKAVPKTEDESVKKFNELEADEELSPEAKKRLDQMIEEDETGTLSDVDYLGEGKSKDKPVQTVKESKIVKEVDESTGTDTSSEMSGLFDQSKEKTEQLAKIFEERKKAVQEDPEVYLQKLINDVNRAKHGESVDLNIVTEKMSELAVRANELRDFFMTGADHIQFMEVAKEAAKWARSAKVPKVSKGDTVNRLNTMIPLDKIPSMLMDILMDIKKTFGAVTVKDVVRNKEIFNKTGFWFGRDGKWRYELDDSKASIDVGNFFADSSVGKDIPLSDVYKHPDLYKAVPELKNTKIINNSTLKEGEGFYYTNVDTIHVNGLNKKLLAHEVQHAINIKLDSDFKGTNVKREYSLQMADRLERIASMLPDKQARDELIRTAKDVKDNYKVLPEASKIYEFLENNGVKGLTKEIKNLLNFPVNAYEIYARNPGEMESRLVEHRLRMTPEQRRAEPPWESLNKMLAEETRPMGEGKKLYSGDPAVEAAAKALVDGAKKVIEYSKKAQGMKAFKPMEAAKMLREEFNRSFVDRSGNIRTELLDKLGEDGFTVLKKLVLSKGASARAAAMLKQMQAEVYSGLSKHEKEVLDRIILDDRLIDIAKYKDEGQYKFPADLTLHDVIAHRELFPRLEKISPERATLIDARAKAYFEWMKKPLKDMLEAGLISEKEYDALVSHNYRRIKLVEIYDKPRAKVGTSKKTVYDSGVEALSRGRDTDIYEPSSEVMALEVFNRAYGRILNNEANKTLLDLARKDPTNEFARVKNNETKIPSGWSRVFVQELGERKTVFISPEMAKEWINSSPELSYRMSQILRWSSGSVITRTFATGIEWGFALANLPRDIMHLWFTARTFENGKWTPVYSPNTPMFGLQIGRDLMNVFSDAALRKGRYRDYINEGGGMEFLVHQGRLFQRGRHLDGPMDTAYDFLGYFGETSEVMTRLAIRDRVIRRRAKEEGISVDEARKNKGITEEATFVARDYMDFGQGGGIAKAADNAFPFLNAGIQGTRGLFRSFKPGSGSALSSTYKLAQLAAITTGVYIAAKASSPNTMKELEGDVRMQNNVCIPLGDSFAFQDDKGQTRYPFIMIPLDQGQKFFKTFFEASADKWMGNEVDVDRVTGALKNLSPVDVSALPPTLAGTIGYMQNRDFWLNEDIWNETKNPFSWPNSRKEFTNRTPQAYVDMGSVTGLSPERSKYAIEQLITRGSMWSYMVNQGYDKAFGDISKEKKEQHLAMVMAEIPGIKRFFGVTKPYSKFASKFDSAEEKSVIKKFEENRGMDTLVESYLYGKNTSREDVFNYAAKFEDRDTYNRLVDRFKWEEIIKDLPQKSFWRRMKGLDAEAKAEMFLDRYNKADEAAKEALWNEYATVALGKGVISREFRREVSRRMVE